MPTAFRPRPTPRGYLADHDAAPLHRRVFLLALAAGAVPTVTLLLLLLLGDYSDKLRWTLGLLVLGSWLAFAAAARERVIHTLQVVASLLSALREGDFTIRGRIHRRDDPLDDVYSEINSLADTLQGQRLSALEATALVRKVIEEMEVAIFAFDDRHILRIVNPAGARLLGSAEERLRGQDATSLGLADALSGPAIRTFDQAFPGGRGRWGMRRSQFYERGVPHQLVVMADLSRALREEEVHAWQRIVRVLGHELNNSLAPVKSIAGSLNRLLASPRRADDWEHDVRSGLEIIEARADGLARFMGAYAQLARLPQPRRTPTAVAPLIRRAASLEERLPVTLIPGPDIDVSLDPAQIEQVLINLLRNAVEAVLLAQDPNAPLPPQRAPAVTLAWSAAAGFITIDIDDTGPGIANPANLFVPFFTTKEKGSGIGLVLCRQIAEAHGGSLTLTNRSPPPGARASLRLPL